MARKHQWLKYIVLALATQLAACGGDSGTVDDDRVDDNGGGTEAPEIPGTENPGTENPGTENPGTENPGTENPGTENPGTGVPGNNDANAIKIYPRSITAENSQLIAVGTDEHGEQFPLTHLVNWQSSDTNTVAVDSSGAVSYLAASSGVILTAEKDGVQASITYVSASDEVITPPTEPPEEPPVTQPDSFVVYFLSPSGPSNVYIWTEDAGEAAGAWPGATMAEAQSQGDGWYSYTISTNQLVNGATNLIFNWNGGNDQTDTLTRSLSDGDSAYDTTNSAWTAVNGSAQSDSTKAFAANVQSLSLYFESPNGVPNAYLWSDAAGEPAGAWPGSAMTSAADQGDNWYVYTMSSSDLDNGMTNVIFNWSNGSEQTDGLTRSLSDGSGVYSTSTNSWTAVAGGSGGDYGDPNGTPILIVCGSTTMRVSLPNSNANICNSENATVNENALLTIDAGSAPFGSTGFSYWSGTGNLYVANPTLATTKFLAVLPDNPIYTNNTVTLALQPIFLSGDPYASIRADYIDQCSSCHGREGEGDESGQFPLLGMSGKYTQATLTTKIADTMPIGAVTICEGDCATDMASLVLAEAFAAPVSACNDADPSVMVTQARNLRALNENEFNQSVTDLLGLTSLFEASTHGNKLTDGSNEYPTSKDLLIDDAKMFKLGTAIDAIWTQVQNNGGIYNLVNSCNATSCFLDQFGEKVFRRALTTREKTAYTTLHAESDDETLLKALFYSPNFMYRSELGELDESGFYKLTDYEIATLLSYTFWGTTPDDTLLTLARQGQLNSQAQIRAQVNRLLLDDVRMEEGLRRFITGWLFNSRYTFKLSDATAEFEDDLREETYQFILAAIRENKPFSEILTADYTYANKSVAEFYGLLAVSSDDAWQKRFYNTGDGEASEDRRGILAHASFLSTRAATGQNNVIQRGVYVRRNILCQDFGTPLGAGDVLAGGSGHEPDHSNREFVELHTENPVCYSCHQFIDGIGFGLDSYGSESEWREFERVHYVDETGNSVFTDNPTNPAGDIKSLVGALPTVLDPNTDLDEFSGIKELAELIDSTTHGSMCAARQFHRYAMGGEEVDYTGVTPTASDSCVVQTFSRGLQNGSQGLRDMLIEYTQNINFTYRAK